MFGGLRPYKLYPLDRGCVNEFVFLAMRKDADGNKTWIDKTNKKLYLTAKTQPWDNVGDDSDATFKALGTIPNPTKEPGRIVFNISEEQSYIDPTIPYFCDIVETDSDGASNAHRLFIGNFNVTPGPNNAQAGGDEES